MRRLIAKELLELRWYVAAILAMVLTLLLLGDPVTYPAGPPATAWFLAPATAAFVMGLSGYSREAAAETLDFTFSRPLRWWWLLLAKTIAGATALAGLTVVSLPVFILRVPALYRPFVNVTSMAHGVAAIWLFLGGAYLAGVLLSSIVPGVVLTLMVVIGGLGLWGLVGTQASEVHPGQWISAPLVGLLVVAAILAVRPPLAVDSRRRIWLWGRSFGLGLLLMPVAAYTLRAGGWNQWPPARLSSYPSPDRQAKAFCGWSSPGEVWVQGADGHVRQVDRAAETQSLGWAPTGRSFYYLVHVHNRAELRCVSEAAGWKPQTVCALERMDNNAGNMAGPTSPFDSAYALDFAPGGRRLSVDMARTGSADEFVAVVDLDRRSVMYIPVIERNGGSHWWIDDNHIALADDHYKVKVTKLWPEKSVGSTGHSSIPLAKKPAPR